MSDNPMARYVEVYRNLPWPGQPMPQANVSWVAIGSRTPDQARQFAAAILAAADKADAMNATQTGAEP